MKTKLILILFLIYSINSFSQGVKNFKLTVYNTNSQVMSNVKVVAKETSSNEKIEKSTNANGIVEFQFTTGKSWWISVGKMYKYTLVEVPESGQGRGSETMTYDLVRWERENRTMPDRSLINFEIITQKIAANKQPDKENTIVQLAIKDAKNKPLTNYPVTLTCLKISKKYIGNTDEKGIARFLVPLNNDYEVDIDGIESFNYIDIKNKPGFEQLGFTYEPTKVVEIDKKDTITQTIDDKSASSSSRVLYKITVNGRANEKVYLDLIGSRKVYVAKTDKNCTATFLLPVKKKYMLNFEYQKDVDVVNLTKIQGIGSGTMSITYIPNPKLEHPEQYIPTSEQLLITDFNYFLTKQFQKPQPEKGLNMIVEWGNNLVNGKSKEAVLNIGFSADNDQSQKYGPPLNISFVMDKSGSMEGENMIGELKKSLIDFVGSLRENDIASLISFNHESELLIPATKIGNKKAEIIDVINNVEAGGGTVILNPLILGYEEVLKNKILKGTNRVILLTDGYGEDETKTMVDKTKEYYEKGIELSAIGVGEGYNQALLTLLATTNGGLFQHVEEKNNLQASFKNELSSMLYPVARDVKVEIEFNNVIIFKQLYGFPFKQTNNKVQMNLNNIYPGLNKLAIVKFDLNKPDKSIENKPVKIRMTFFNYRTNKQEIQEETVYLKWNESDGSTELIVENEYKKLYAIAIMNQSLKVMADAFEVNEFEKAQSAVERAIIQINELFPNSMNEDVSKLYKTLDEYSKILKQYKLNKIKKPVQK